jgi:hypothetical protein
MRGQKPHKSSAESQWLKIARPEAGYAGSVVTLVARVSRTPSGRAVLESIRDSGSVVGIEKPEVPTDPPNAWTERRAATTMAGVDVVICFDPADWPSPIEPEPRPADVVMFELLEAAARMASGEGADGDVSPARQAYLRERGPPGGSVQ